MKIEDFEIKEVRGKLQIKYIGKEKGIDLCITELNPKFATYHLVKLLLNK